MTRNLSKTPGSALVLLTLILLTVSGCQQTRRSGPPLELSELSVAGTGSEVQGEAEPVGDQAGAEQPGKADSFATPETSKTEPPLRFTLPTPGPAPISLWRPPLYDTPWALGPFDHFYFNRPIAADEVNWPEPDYRYGGIFFGSDIVHTGIDIPIPTGTPILAAANGRVVSAGYGLYYGTNDPNDPYGLAVTIRHDFGYQGQRLYTVYAHMDKVLAEIGQEVKTGDVIGEVGTTGLTTGPHLHFEVRMERNSYFTTYNPELWLAPPQGWGVLAGQLLNTNGSLLSEQDVTVRNLETKQKWVVRSYGNQAVNSDPYYNENLVLSDLPAGRYEVIIDYLDERYQANLDIYPGAVSYFKFRGKLYFDTSLPITPSIDTIPGADLP